MAVKSVFKSNKFLEFCKTKLNIVEMWQYFINSGIFAGFAQISEMFVGFEI